VRCANVLPRAATPLPKAHNLGHQIGMAEATNTATGGKNLQREVALGLARLQVIMMLLIFIPAGSLRFWQGWLFSIVFLASVVFLTFHFLKRDPHLIENRMKGGPGAEQQRSQKIIQAFTGMLAAALVIIPGLDHRYQWSSVPGTIVMVANLAVILGFLIIYRVFEENSFAASTIKVEAGQRVISTGPYRWVRHPMYAGGAAAPPRDAVGARIALGLANRLRYHTRDSPSAAR
jgi:isoprenylcysteine carboxyl methyltransferase (ICMT) family protein YpbQ